MVLRRELDRVVSRRLYFGVCIVLPLFCIFFMSTIFGSGQMENIPIAVVDQDNTSMSREIVRQVEAVPTFRVTRHYTDQETARHATQAKDSYGYLVIPNQFEADATAGRDATLSYYYHYALLSVGGEVRGVFETLLRTLSLAPVVVQATAMGVGENQITTFLLPVRSSSHPLFNPDLDYSVYLSNPFFFVFFQVIILLVTVYAIGSEIKFRTGDEWLEAARMNMFVAVVGKLLPYTVIFCIMSVFANYIMFGVMHIPFACGFWPLNLTAILFVVATQALADIASLVKDEFKTISTSYAILLVLVGGIFLYGLLYNYMYAPDVVRNAPVVVVDDSKTDLSREYIRLLNATPQVSVIADGLDYAEAQDWMKEGDAVGILYLPSDFETRVARGNESLFIMYQTTSAFLYYMAMQEASSGAMLALNDRYRPEMLVFLPQQDASKIVSAQPISVVGTALYNFTEGYGTYLIPAVLIVIMFQTLLMVIGMISGEERDSGTIARFASEGLSFGQIAGVIISKTFVYCVLYTIFALFLLGLIPLLFGLPDIGNYLNTLILLIPFLLATSFFGLAASYFFTDSEAPLLMIAFFSVGLIFLSGVSYPLELMPWYWQMAHYIIPAAPATLAYVQLNSMGASIEQVGVEYVTLWVQCVVYFLLACWVYRRNILKASRALSSL